MSLREKAKFLAELQQRVPKKLEARMDEAISRLSALEKKDKSVFDPLSAQLDEHEAGLTEVEEAVSTIERGLNAVRPTTDTDTFPGLSRITPMPKYDDNTIPNSPQHDMIKKANNS